jgi:hypothetical protein
MRRRPALPTMVTLLLVAAGVPATATVTEPAHEPAPAAPRAIASSSGPTGLEGKEIIVVNGLGTGRDQNPDPIAFDITVPLVSLATGTVVGRVRHEPRCATDSVPCLVLDDQDTYDLGDGTIVTRSKVSLSPDPAHPHILLSSGRPPEKNVVKATGAYAGRTGRVRVSGIVDVARFPSEFTLDEIYVIVLDPR